MNLLEYLRISLERTIRFGITAGYLTIIFFLINPKIAAETCTINEAQTVAANWLQYMVYQKGHWANTETPTISNYIHIVSSDTLLGYLFNISPRGFIAVPVLKEMPPIKAYSDTDDIQASDFDEILGIAALIRDVLQRRAREYVKRYGNLDAVQPAIGEVLLGREHRERWLEFLKSEEEFQSELIQKKFLRLTEVGPLLTTEWHQGDPYNIYCPLGCGNVQTYVGCVATAVAQIAKKWNWPNVGTETHSYHWDGDDACYPPQPQNGLDLTADFTDPFNFGNMPDNCDNGCTTGQQIALGELSFKIAVGCDMDFGTDGSGTYFSNAIHALTEHLKYGSEMNMIYRDDYTLNEWFQFIQEEINNDRPILYGMFWNPPGGTVGHAIVCDGWRDTGGQEEYHMNYGWGGSHNAWYVLDQLYCQNYPCFDESMVRNIEPDY